MHKFQHKFQQAQNGTNITNGRQTWSTWLDRLGKARLCAKSSGPRTRKVGSPEKMGQQCYTNPQGQQVCRFCPPRNGCIQWGNVTCGSFMCLRGSSMPDVTNATECCQGKKGKVEW